MIPKRTGSTVSPYKHEQKMRGNSLAAEGQNDARAVLCLCRGTTQHIRKCPNEYGADIVLYPYEVDLVAQIKNLMGGAQQ